MVVELVFLKTVPLGQQEIGRVFWDGKKLMGPANLIEGLMEFTDDVEQAVAQAEARFDGAYLRVKVVGEATKGGEGSGHFEHEGRPGEIGGSEPSGTAEPKQQTPIQRGYYKKPPTAKPAPTGPTLALQPPYKQQLAATQYHVAVGDEKTALLNDQFRKHCVYDPLTGNVGDTEVPINCWRWAREAVRGKIKRALIQRLSERTGIDKLVINNMIKAWANTSNNKKPLSLLIQYAANQELGVGLSAWQRQKIAGMGGVLELERSNMRAYSLANVRKYVRAVYEETQEQLAALGFKKGDRVTLFRGASVSKPEGRGIDTGNVIRYRGNAIESWSLSIEKASDFESWHPPGTARLGVTMSARVPVGNIVSTALTGMGCFTEGEVVVAGSNWDDQVMVEARQ